MSVPSYDPREHVLEVRDTPSGRVVVTTDEALGLAQREALGGDAILRLLPDLALGAKTQGLVQVSVAPLRAEPRQASEQISQLLMGHPVAILEKANADWWRVRGPEGYLGYLHREHVLPANPCWNTGYAALPKRMVASNYAQAFADAYDRTEPVFDVSVGCILGIGDRWIDLNDSGYVVYTPDMRRGFLSDTHLLPAEVPAFTPEAMLPWIRRWMGTPYLWGGVSPRGIDCSGVVQLAGILLGKRFPRDASQQVHLGQPVESTHWQDLRPGDLLFFGDKPGKITHVAVYEGEGKYLHASGRVRRNSLRPEDADFEPHRFSTWQQTRTLT